MSTKEKPDNFYPIKRFFFFYQIISTKEGFKKCASPNEVFKVWKITWDDQKWKKKKRKRREKGKDWGGEKYHSVMTIFLVADLEGEI